MPCGCGGSPAIAIVGPRGPPLTAQPPSDSFMALRKSPLYALFWQSCDQLRGGMDLSQFKDYILTLAFTKCFKVPAYTVSGDTPCVELEHIGQNDGRLVGRDAASTYRFLLAAYPVGSH